MMPGPRPPDHHLALTLLAPALLAALAGNGVAAPAPATPASAPVARTPAARTPAAPAPAVPAPAPARPAPVLKVVAPVKPGAVSPLSMRPVATAHPLPAWPPRLGPRREVGWGPGETMTFIIKLAGIEGGRGAISVGAPKTKGGRRMLRVRGLSETSPLVSAFHRLREDVITQLDLEGVLTVQSLDDRLLKQRRRKLETTFDAPLIRQSIQQDGATNLRERRIAPPVFDGLTVLFLLRSSPLTPGSRLDVRVLTGLTLYRAELTVVGRERVLVRDRTREAIRIDGVAREIDDQDRPVAKEPLRKFSFWLSADRFHVPLRLEGDTKLGPVEAALLTHTATRAPLLLRPALLLIKNGAAQRRGQSSEAAATSNEGKRSR